jgi:hypothetical protein
VFNGGGVREARLGPIRIRTGGEACPHFRVTAKCHVRAAVMMYDVRSKIARGEESLVRQRRSCRGIVMRDRI